MRIPLGILACVVCAWGADVDHPQPTNVAYQPQSGTARAQAPDPSAHAPVAAIPWAASLKQLHHLPLSIIAGHPSVVVEGVVTDLTFMPHGFTLQDATDGIYVVFRTAKTVLRRGQRIRIWGTGDAGAFAPVVLADRVEILGYGALPHPQSVSPIEFANGSLDNVYVEVRGIVRTATITSSDGRAYGIMRLATRDGSLLLVARDLGKGPAKYIDSIVRARGVAGIEFNLRGQAMGLRVNIADIGDITIERPSPLDPFSAAVTPINTIMRFEAARDWSRRLRIQGAVTLQQPGEFVVVQDGNGAIRVDTRTEQTLAAGTLLDATGFVSTEAYSPTLKDALIRRQGTSITVKPVARRAADLLAGGSDSSLITTVGTLIESGQSATGLTLLIEDRGTKYAAELRNGRPEHFDVASGSQIRITGVCENFSDAVHQTRSFRLLLRSVSDINVVKKAPLLKNREFLVRSGVAFAILTVLSALWALTLRRRVRRQTNWIQASLIKEKAVASQDPLTGLANRRHFGDSLALALRNAGNAGTEVALFYLDLGDFKRINDMMGHAAGDVLLKQVAKRLAGVLDSTELVSRVGGDEFTVIQLNAGAQASEELARRLLDSFRDAFVVFDGRIQVAASIGISRYPVDADNAEQLLHNADTAMYHAKRKGRGFHFFDSAMEVLLRRKLEIRRELNGALERGEFFAHFQPIEDLSTGSIVRFEALCRWNSEQIGSVPPSEFIPVAEETGQINAIGKWMLHHACMEGRSWQLDEHSPVRLAVNVSAVQFAAEDFVESVTGILDATGFPAPLLELELTESVLIGDPEESIRKMYQLRRMGIGLSIDDFGTGYSSLSYVQSMPVDALKIDRSFTAKLESSVTAVTMVRSVIAMGRSLGLRITTEGVESAAQLEIVRQLGTDEVQGYLIGKPATAEAALQRVAAQAHSHRPDSQLVV
jgi:diguanylate cyclase (GGDEF)-like protein